MSSPVLQATGLTKRYGRRRALSDCTLIHSGRSRRRPGRPERRRQDDVAADRRWYAAAHVRDD